MRDGLGSERSGNSSQESSAIRIQWSRLISPLIVDYTVGDRLAG